MYSSSQIVETVINTFKIITIRRIESETESETDQIQIPNK